MNGPNIWQICDVLELPKRRTSQTSDWNWPIEMSFPDSFSVRVSDRKENKHNRQAGKEVSYRTGQSFQAYAESVADSPANVSHAETLLFRSLLQHLSDNSG